MRLMDHAQVPLTCPRLLGGFDQLADHRILSGAVADDHPQAGDGPGLVGGDRVLHPHRLDHPTRTSPSSTCWPSWTATVVMVPCIGAVTPVTAGRTALG